MDAAASVDAAELAQYYARLYPFERIAQWLAYGRADLLGRREVAMPAGDTFRRHLSYHYGHQLRAAVAAHAPERIEFGAVFAIPPAQRLRHPHDAYKAVERELTIDLDLTDYDDVRTCCQGKCACRICWQLVVAGMRILDVALREDFGFEHLLWVFSGRRGVHCWICDERARRLTDDGRGAIVGYLTVDRTRPLTAAQAAHPALQRARRILDQLSHRLPPLPAGGGDPLLAFYPRLDAQVTSKLNHLLKSPFSVHPATGRVCVPLDPMAADAFDPALTPTVASLLAELDSWAGPDDVPEARRTALCGAVDELAAFVKRLQHDRLAAPDLDAMEWWMHCIHVGI